MLILAFLLASASMELRQQEVTFWINHDCACHLECEEYQVPMACEDLDPRTRVNLP